MKRKNRQRSARRGRGIYILPNIFTSLNILFGFYALICSIDGKFIPAAIAIILAGLFDELDGKIARATHTTSNFGIQYDSLADLVSFGVAPGVMVYLWALRPLGRIGWLAAFLFTVCGALRLARFNTQAGGVSDNTYFTGMPIPAAAGIVSTTLLFYHRLNRGGDPSALLLLVLTYLLSFLMVSNIRYFSFKNLELFKKMNFNGLVMVILVLVFIVAQPSIALFLAGLVYLVHGPILTIRHMKKIKRQKEMEARHSDT
ncbi:MAG: CDP-diacylglycerol--serine O-phosphatidyltransferase [Deltaproteobacteria bacterium]|nr:MAG: CDP-diacylglycerol--serine O-phosphatidyltransferase [Deltaproteobacteria bacterium]